jgi:hypothetical protein
VDVADAFVQDVEVERGLELGPVVYLHDLHRERHTLAHVARHRDVAGDFFDVMQDRQTVTDLA